MLTRFHPHLIVPFRNESIYRKTFSHNTVTGFILIGSFLVGYVYSRLRRDEWARRRAYARYTNLMILFDKYSKILEHYYGSTYDFMMNFDHTYYLWKIKTLKLSEWKLSRKFEKEILKK